MALVADLHQERGAQISPAPHQVGVGVHQLGDAFDHGCAQVRAAARRSGRITFDQSGNCLTRFAAFMRSASALIWATMSGVMSGATLICLTMLSAMSRVTFA